MSKQPVTMVGIDTELLEDLAHRKLGMSAIRRIRSRFNLSEDEAIRLGVEAVHEARRER
jgi:hypothetical protein